MAAQASPVFRNVEEGSKLIKGNTAFTWNLYKKLSAANPNQNVFFSPASISLALAMTYNGAKNATRDQMKAALGFETVSEDHLHTSFEDLHTALHNAGDDYKLNSANRIYADQSYSFLQSFLDATKTHYKAELSPVDFQKNYEAARQEINQWVESQTASKIKDLLQDGSLDSMTRMVLVNAIYFKGNWASQFDPAKTRVEEFQASESEKIPAKFMEQNRKFSFGWSREKQAKVLLLPYVNERLSMVFVLPNDWYQLAAVEAALSADDLVNIEEVFSVRQMKTVVTLPRFKLTQSFDLGDTLADLGMADLFDMGKADLSGIDGSSELFVSKVVHKAFIEVNEEGSEAAAATAVKVMLRSAGLPAEFYANQPFLFFIRDNQSKAILFFGRFSRPDASAAKDEL